MSAKLPFKGENIEFSLVVQNYPPPWQPRWKREGLGGFSPPNSLLKFVDFVNEKFCKSQGRKNDTFSKNRVFSNDLKGVVMENFTGGKPPDPVFPSFALTSFQPPNINFVPTGLPGTQDFK